MTDTQTGALLDFGLTGPGLLRTLANNWWFLLLRGVAAVIFGVLAFFWPGLTLITLTLLWGAYALTDGIIAIWAAPSQCPDSKKVERLLRFTSFSFAYLGFPNHQP